MPSSLPRSLNQIAVTLQHSNIFYFFSRLLLGGAFLYASLDKIAHPQDFATVIQNYRLLPAPYTSLLAVILPWIEALTGLFLLLGLFTRACASIFLGLLLIFMGALTSALLRGLDIGCGCFDLRNKTSSSINLLNAIFRDLLLACLAGQILASHSQKFSLANLLPPKLKRLIE